MYDVQYNIVGVNGRHIEHDIIPTPRLLSEGTRTYVEAYKFSELHGQSLWRVRDDTYDEPDTEYQRVRVERVEIPWL